MTSKKLHVSDSRRNSAKRKQCSFKKKTYEAQYKFNEEVSDNMDEALEALGSGKADAQTKAKQAFEEGKEQIGTRQKLLKTKDRSDGGWRVAEEYQRDPVAENRDEKRIRKAKKKLSRS